MSHLIDDDLGLEKIHSCRDCDSENLAVDKEAGTHIVCIDCETRQPRYKTPEEE